MQQIILKHWYTKFFPELEHLIEAGKASGDPEKVKADDIVTFQTKSGEVLTHRVAEIKPDGEIVTKGDANNAPDSWEDGWKLGEGARFS